MKQRITISFRLTETEFFAIQAFIQGRGQTFGFRNISEVIRTALWEFLKSNVDGLKDNEHAQLFRIKLNAMKAEVERERTKELLRNETYPSNVRKLLKKLIQQNTPTDNLKEIAKGIILEAEARNKKKEIEGILAEFKII